MIYLDNASTTYPKFNKLYDDTMKIYREVGINFSRNNSRKSKSAYEIKNNLIVNLKKIFSSNAHKVIINSSATFSLNEIITGLNYPKIKTIYISPFEHNSVYRTLKKVQRENGIDIEILKFNQFEIDENDMKLKFLSKKPDVVILTHASNVFGNILPAEKIFNVAKTYGAITILDAAQTGGVLDFSLISKVSDFIVFAGHKNLYGPSGIGGYLFLNDVLIKPLIVGGTGIKSEEEDMPKEIPERYEAGSPNILGMIGLEIATTELLKIGIENIYNKKMENLKLMYEILNDFKYDIKIHSQLKENIGIISVTGIAFSPKELEGILNEHGVSVRSGMQCAPLAHRHIGTEKTGTVRFSVGYFNEGGNFQRLREILEEVF
ncbi:MAG: aminotransferase class V-fold PLP-dependent enzyme [Leptotrichiaceae bacterium]|nr:aminotransferase class V-fold PLP-dependent enzyme [Leptotrichiaceae bacterium]